MITTNSAVKRGLPLQTGIIYGPVRSRRLGKSLGINLLSTTCKVCPFDCVYCQYGRTDIKTLSSARHLFPRVEKVVQTLEAALEQTPDLDVITFSGNGEPTLHPNFDQIVDAAVTMRNQRRPGTPLAVLSCGATAYVPRIRLALNKLDMRIMKLDAGRDETFRAVNRPIPAVSYETLVEGLRELRSVIVQTMLVKGHVANTSRQAISHLAEMLNRIQPTAVQLYTLDRPPAEAGIQPVTREDLAIIARQLVHETGLVVKVYA
jgi:wyosine [tRNA(Phe)-imidazoG37] synthetase (radical SAM superfamily)